MTWRPTRREVVLTLAALPALPRLVRVERVRFSNISFELPAAFVVALSEPQMILQVGQEPDEQPVLVVIDPVAYRVGTVEETFATAWSDAVGSAGTTGDPVNEERAINAGAKVSIRLQETTSGGRGIAVVTVGEYVTTLTFIAESDRAYAGTRSDFLSMARSILVNEASLKVSGSAAEGFDWNGPDAFVYDIYDHGCRHPKDELEQLLKASQGMAGSVRPRTVSFADAVAAINLLMKEPAAKENIEAAGASGSRETPSLYAIGAATRLLQGDPLGAVVQMGVALREAPRDPNVLFNAAAALAHAGMPNESLAVLGQLESAGTMPTLGMKLDPQGAIAHVRGYAQMLRGELAAAETSLARARKLEPVLIESTHTLSVVQAAAGRRAEALATYRRGMYRKMPARLVDCQAPEDGPYTVRADEDADEWRPPIDETHDTSKGRIVALPQFRHPGNIDDLQKVTERAGNVGLDLTMQGQALAQQAIAFSAAVDQTRSTPYDAWAYKMSSLIGSLEQTEPLLRKLSRQLDAARDSAAEACGRFGVAHLKRVNEIGPGTEAYVCRTMRDSANRGITQARPHAYVVEMAHRRYARAWYRMATGLAAHIGEPNWHKWVATDLRSGMLMFQGNFLVNVLTYYGPFLAVGGNCPIEDPPLNMTGTPADGAVSCPDALRGAGLKFAFDLPGGRTPKLAFKINCDKISVEASYDVARINAGPLLEAGAGPFVQLELANKGRFTIFAGAKEQITVVGVGESGKQGFYISGDRDGIDAIGVRTTGEYIQKSGIGGAAVTISSKIDAVGLDYNFLPTVPAPLRGPIIPLVPIGTK